MSKNKKISTKLAALFVAGMLAVSMATVPAFAADAPPSINFSFGDEPADTGDNDGNSGDDDAPPSLGTTSTPSTTVTTSPPRPVVPPAPQPTRTVTTATPKRVTKTGPGLLYPILLGVSSLYYFRKRQK